MGRLDGKVAVVTGGARGQGRAHALALAAEGARVALWDIAAPMETVPYPLADAAELQHTVALVEQAGGTGIGVVADVRRSEDVEAAHQETAQRLGPVDVMVVNAGVCGYYPFTAITDAVWDDMIETNLTGAFRCMRAVVPAMVERGYGRIVATSSIAGRTGSPNLAHYAAAKWGLIGLVKTVALETARSGVTANVICPTTVRTPMVENEQNYRLFCPDIESPTLEDAFPRFGRLNPMQRPWLEPEAVARAMLYFATDTDGDQSGVVLEVGLGSSALRT